MIFFSDSEFEHAKRRDDLTGIKTKCLKLNMDLIEDRMLYLYLQNKSFTEVSKQALGIYKQHFDPDILVKKQLERLQETNPTMFQSDISQPNQSQPQPLRPATISANVSDL